MTPRDTHEHVFAARASKTTLDGMGNDTKGRGKSERHGEDGIDAAVKRERKGGAGLTVVSSELNPA